MKSSFKIHFIALAMLMASFHTSAAEDNAVLGNVEVGEKINSSLCAACHGEQGLSKNEIWPNLAGQRRAYLLKQLQDFKEGKRADPVMSPIASMLSDEDMRHLVAYFVSLPPQ